MPDGRLQRTRASLPEGYQFPDASRRAVAHDAAEREWYRTLSKVEHVHGTFRPLGVDLRTVDLVTDTVSTE